MKININSQDKQLSIHNAMLNVFHVTDQEENTITSDTASFYPYPPYPDVEDFERLNRFLNWLNIEFANNSVEIEVNIKVK